MARQLTLDGREVSHPPPKDPRLTTSQRLILRHIGREGTIRPIEAGRYVHSCRDAIYVNPRYFSSDGAAALKRLAKRGFVYRYERGDWRATGGA